MRISAFTDEIDRNDLAKAIELAVRWGVEAVEIRGLPAGRFLQASDADLHDAGSRIADAGLLVSGVSPGLFKEPVQSESMATDLRERLPRACEWARRWGCDRISVFASTRGDTPHGEGQVPDVVVEHLGRMADAAAAAGCRLSLENVANCWGDTGTQAAQIVRSVGPRRLRLCWDPGNAGRAQVAAPVDEYAGLADLVDHVHVKNFLDADWSLVDSGVVDWRAQLDALRDDGYDGWLVVETHLQELPAGMDAILDAGELLPPQASNTKHNLQTLRRLLAES